MSTIEDLSRTQLVRRVRDLEVELERERVSARTDALTQLANRRAGEAALLAATSLAKRNERPFAVLMLDIDHFKRINDTFGHDVGDEALREVAAALRSNVRPSDMACRWAGEEFLVVCPETTEAQATVLAQRLRRAVAAISIPILPQGMTVSIGASGAPGIVYEPNVLVKCADRALYEAKAGGRNRVARIFEAA